jgi:hypothetical protein
MSNTTPTVPTFLGKQNNGRVPFLGMRDQNVHGTDLNTDITTGTPIFFKQKGFIGSDGVRCCRDPFFHLDPTILLQFEETESSLFIDS